MYMRYSQQDGFVYSTLQNGSAVQEATASIVSQTTLLYPALTLTAAEFRHMLCDIMHLALLCPGPCLVDCVACMGRTGPSWAARDHLPPFSACASLQRSCSSGPCWSGTEQLVGPVMLLWSCMTWPCRCRLHQPRTRLQRKAPAGPDATLLRSFPQTRHAKAPCRTAHATFLNTMHFTCIP